MVRKIQLIAMTAVIIFSLACDAWALDLKSIFNDNTSNKTEWEKKQEAKQKSPKGKTYEEEYKERADKIRARDEAKKRAMQDEATRIQAEKDRNSIDVTTLQVTEIPVANIINPYKPFNYGDTYFEVLAKLHKIGVKTIDGNPISEYKMAVINQTTFDHIEKLAIKEAEYFEYKGMTISMPEMGFSIKAFPINIMGVDYEAELNLQAIDKDYAIWLCENKKNVVKKQTIDGKMVYAPAGLCEIQLTIPYKSVDETTKEVNQKKIRAILKEKYGKWATGHSDKEGWFMAEKDGTSLEFTPWVFTYSGLGYLDSFNNGVYKKYIESKAPTKKDSSL